MSNPSSGVRARPIWIQSRFLVDLADILLQVLSDTRFCKQVTKETGISIERISEIADKLRREIDKL